MGFEREEGWMRHRKALVVCVVIVGGGALLDLEVVLLAVLDLVDDCAVGVRSLVGSLPDCPW